MQKFGLKIWRLNAGLTQKELAKQMGKSNKTISKWEKGESFPTSKDIDKLCEILKVSYDNINFLHNDSL